MQGTRGRSPFHFNWKGLTQGKNRLWHMAGRRVKVAQGTWNLFSHSARQSVKQTRCQSQVTQTGLGSECLGTVTLYLQPALWRRSRHWTAFSQIASMEVSQKPQSTFKSECASVFLCLNGSTHVLLSMCSCPFVCFCTGIWPLNWIISLATTLHLFLLLCNCSKYWL